MILMNKALFSTIQHIKMFHSVSIFKFRNGHRDDDRVQKLPSIMFMLKFLTRPPIIHSRLFSLIKQSIHINQVAGSVYTNFFFRYFLFLIHETIHICLNSLFWGHIKRHDTFHKIRIFLHLSLLPKQSLHKPPLPLLVDNQVHLLFSFEFLEVKRINQIQINSDTLPHRFLFLILCSSYLFSCLNLKNGFRICSFCHLLLYIYVSAIHDSIFLLCKPIFSSRQKAESH